MKRFDSRRFALVVAAMLAIALNARCELVTPCRPPTAPTKPNL